MEASEFRTQISDQK